MSKSVRLQCLRIRLDPAEQPEGVAQPGQDSTAGATEHNGSGSSAWLLEPLGASGGSTVATRRHSPIAVAAPRGSDGKGGGPLARCVVATAVLTPLPGGVSAYSTRCSACAPLA